MSYKNFSLRKAFMVIINVISVKVKGSALSKSITTLHRASKDEDYELIWEDTPIITFNP